MSLKFQGVHLDILNDRTPEICVLGARDSGKTTVCVYKEIKFLMDYPKLKSFLFRFSDKDTQSKLVPFFREMCCDEFNETPAWDAKESCFNFANGSIAYMFGLQAQSASQRYSKMRGLGVARAMAEQAEELASDLGLELRAALRQPGFQHVYQLTYCANPPPEKSWIVKQFPIDQRFKNRRLFMVSLYDNAHNLSADTIHGLEQAFPPDHPKHRTIILGLPGINVTGEAIYGKLFNPALHHRPIAYNPKLPLLEVYDFGTLNPCWCVAQRPYGGGIYWLGGIMGQEMFMEDFIPLMQQYKADWFPNLKAENARSCCTLSVSKAAARTVSGVQQLRREGIFPRWVENGNSPDIVLAMIENQATYLRRRGIDGKEMLGVNNDETHWLKANEEGVEQSQWMMQAYYGGYCWSDKTVSVGRNEVKQPFIDDWFIYGMRCAEALELNFNHRKRTQLEVDECSAAQRRREAANREDQAPSGPHVWLRG